jgi:hypothetical protein
MNRLLMLLPAALLGCGPSIPAPGQGSNGTFLFLAHTLDRPPSLDALCVASRGGLVFAGTSADLRLLKGSKLQGFSEPSSIDIRPGYPAEVNGLAFGPGDQLYVGYSQGIAVVDTGSLEVGQRLPLPKPVAKLYRDGDRLIALSFDNDLTVLSLAAPSRPAVVGTLSLEGGTGTIRSATIQPGKATLTAPGALWVVDVSSAPRLVATQALDILGASVRGDGFLFTGNTGPRAVLAMPTDQSVTPAGPATSPWRLPGAAPVLSGKRLFMVDDDNGDVYIADVTQPTAPTFVTSLKPDRERVACGDIHDSTLDDDQVLWVACAGGLVNYVIDY